MTSLIKTSEQIATSLHGSAFRRVTMDGRTRFLRAIPTWGGRAARSSSSSLRPGRAPSRPL